MKIGLMPCRIFKILRDFFFYFIDYNQLDTKTESLEARHVLRRRRRRRFEIEFRASSALAKRRVGGWRGGGEHNTTVEKPSNSTVKQRAQYAIRRRHYTHLLHGRGFREITLFGVKLNCARV